MIRRRSSARSKDVRPAADAPAPFFNLNADAPPEEAPLFNLEEVHERRILSWSPEPEEPEGFDQEARDQPETGPSSDAHGPSAAPAPRVVDAPVAVTAPTTLPIGAPVPATEPIAAPTASLATGYPPVEAPARIVSPPRPVEVEPVRQVAPPAAPVVVPSTEPIETATAEADSEQPDTSSAAPKRRGRPRGRPRRQVHFHVDPDEERLLMMAVERYGSQQKGLIAALESLQEAELLRDEIERLRAETARNRQLLDEAGALFKR